MNVSMPHIPPQKVQITCPNCGHVFQTDVYFLIDVQQQPELKLYLLAGQLNLATCPSCHTLAHIPLPVVYHDAEKHSCFIHTPQEHGLHSDEQERIIGESTRMIIDALPPDAPRGYLLTPRRFMHLSSMIEAILEGEKEQVHLIKTLADAVDDDQQFMRLLEQHADEINNELFAMLSALLETSTQQEQKETAEKLRGLRDKLLQLAGLQGQMQHAMPEDINQVFERLEQATDDELEDIIAEVRPLIDYGFFQAWTARIEQKEQAGQPQEAQRLYQRRGQVVEIVEKVDKEAQAIFEDSANLLREALHAPDPRAVLEEKSDQLNEAFIMILSSQIEAAKQAGQHEIATRLEEMTMMAVEIIQSKLPPEERFINELLMAESPQESSKLMRQNSAMVTTEFVKKLNELAAEQEKRGFADNATRLRQLAREAGALLY
jgi:hemerythrin-like domain-containing protein